jgi:hypothetical protein
MSPAGTASTDSALIPNLPNALRASVAGSANWFVLNIGDMIAQLNALGAKLPKKYGWRYRTVEAFTAELNELAEAKNSVFECNKLYWKDALGICEAYSLMTTWRTIGLARSCVWALAREDNLCAALLARASLETAAQFVDATRTINGTICDSGMLDPSADMRRNVYASKPFEEYLLKTVFASRLPDSEKIYEAINIVTIVKRIAKSPGQEFVLPTYELLCEIAHPNFLGRSVYLLEVRPGPRPGHEIHTIGLGQGSTSAKFSEPIIAALSWACGTQVTAFALMSDTIKAVMTSIAERRP